MSADIHVHIARLVVDRAAAPGTEVAGLRDAVAGRIATGLTGNRADTTERTSPLAAAIGDAVVSRVSRQVGGEGRNRS